MADVVRQMPSSPFGTFLYDPKKDHYQFDAQAKRILGELAHPDAHYIDMLACMPPVVRRVYEQWRMEAIETGKAGRVRVPFQLPTRKIILEIQIQNLGDGVQGMIADVTQDERDYQETMHQLMVMNFAERIAGFGIWAYDIQEDSFTASKGAVDLLLPGADPSEFTLERVLDLVHEDDRHSIREAYVEALRWGQVQHVEFRRTGESQRWFVVQFMRILDEASDPVRVYGMIHETTDLHHHEELAARHDALVDVQELRARFVNAAAHELSQPMTPLRIQLSLLRQHLAEDEKAQRGLTVIERNLERVGFILNDLLDAARSQAGHLRVDPRPVHVAEHVSHVVDTLSGMAKQRGVTLDCRLDGDPVARADPMRLQQCLNNLIHNAIKFTAEGTCIDVNVHEEGDLVIVGVRDHGPGLDKGQARRVFEPFEQVHQAPAGYSGTGLGLYITQALMHAMDGAVEVESTPGEGSRFFLQLPAAEVGIG